MTFCWRSTDSRYLAWVGFEAMRAVVCASLAWRLLIWALSAAIWLSTDRMMAERRLESCSSICTTRGFFCEVLARSELRSSSWLLYSAIWLSILMLSMPELAGMSCRRLASLLRWSRM